MMVKLKPLLHIPVKVLFASSLLVQLAACGGGSAGTNDAANLVSSSTVPDTTTAAEQSIQAVSGNSDITTVVESTEQAFQSTPIDFDIATSVASAETILPPVSSNSAPTLSGDPDTSITVGDYYSFQLTARDPDGDELTFSIQNRPAWISFNNSDGSLSGTPMDGDIGPSENIIITASDGPTSTSIGPFSIRVNSPSSKRVATSYMVSSQLARLF